MRHILFIMLIVALPTTSQGQTKAVTETGDQVILYADGTYEYLNEAEAPNKEIPMNPTAFERAEQASFLLKSERVGVGFWLDPKKWSFSKPTENMDAEYEIALKGEDLYGVIITEKIEIPAENLKQIAFENARSVAPDLKLVHEEYRMVNGQKVLLVQMDGTMQGMKISYYGYLFSNPSGTVQFVTFTSQNLLDQYKEYSEEVLNGMVVL